jgi:hypothetical protein
MSELDDFYSLVADLRARCGGERQLAKCDGRMSWPERGVYLFFEEGEIRPNGEPRVVRVGTHALTAASRTTLSKRLSQHRGNVGGGRPGGGNHRGSIFRLHVGQCLLARDDDPYGVLGTWGDKATAATSVRHGEYPHEAAVSSYIGQMPFLWLPVLDDPGPDSARGVIEAGAIALLSRRSNPDADPSSEQWLGRWSSRATVRESGLWNVRHVDGPRSDVLLPILERHIRSAPPLIR